MIRTLALAALLSIATALPASAETLRTPVGSAGNGNTLVCSALNVGKKTINSVQVAFLNTLGVEAQIADCPDLAPGAFCLALESSTAFVTCRIVHDGKKKDVRGNLQVRDPNDSTALNMEAR